MVLACQTEGSGHFLLSVPLGVQHRSARLSRCLLISGNRLQPAAPRAQAPHAGQWPRHWGKGRPHERLWGAGLPGGWTQTLGWGW